MNLDANDRVHQLVQRPSVYVHPNDTLRRVATTLVEESIGAALVRGPHGAIGLVSERDLARAIAEGADPDRARVEDLMTEDLVTVDHNDELLDAVHAMLAAEVRHLPVMDGDVPAGMVSARDALSALAAERDRAPA